MGTDERRTGSIRSRPNSIRDAALRRLRAATDGADDGELFLERRRSEVLVFDDGRLRTAGYDASEGFGLRAVRGETTGYAHATEMTDAALAAPATPPGWPWARAAARWRSRRSAPTAALFRPDPLIEAPFAAKIDTLREIDAFARDLDSRVVQVSATLSRPSRRS